MMSKIKGSTWDQVLMVILALNQVEIGPNTI
jgi:hypothetical protein